jgi:hypothetical protein
MTSVLIRRLEDELDSEEKVCVVTETDIRFMQPQANGCQGLPGATGN